MARDDSASFIDPETVLIDFTALQYSLFLTTIIAGLSAVFFFANAWYLVVNLLNILINFINVTIIPGTSWKTKLK